MEAQPDKKQADTANIIIFCEQETVILFIVKYSNIRSAMAEPDP